MSTAVSSSASARPAVPAWQVLARMRWRVLLRTFATGDTRAWTWSGTILGTIAGSATAVAGALDPELVPALLGLWLLGWIVAPVLTGRSDPLRPELFAASGLSRTRLVVAVLWGSLVSVPVAVTTLACAAIVIGTATAGAGAAAVTSAAVASASTALAIVAIGRLAAAVIAVLLRTRAGAILAGSVTGLAMALVAQGWALVPATGSSSVQDAAARVGGILPSGWGTTAVEAITGGEPATAVALLAAQLATTAAAVTGWGLLTSARLEGRRHAVRPRRLLRAPDIDGAARAAERRAWSRDLVASQRWSFALVYAVAFCALPLAIGWSGMLPWIGPAFLVMVATLGSNGIGMTGTSLWLVLAAGAGRADVRARAAGVAARAGIVAVALTVLTSPWAGSQLPVAVACTITGVGAAAGISVALGVWMPSRATDPHQRAADPLDTGGGAEALGAAYLALLAMLVLIAPAAALGVLIGWWAIPCALVLGVVSYRGLVELASRRLERDGDLVLAVLRGTPASSIAVEAGTAAATLTAPIQARYASLPRLTRILVSVGFGLGAIPLIPQGILPLVFLARDTPARAWFLAMYVPAPWGVAVAVGMVILGLAMFTVATATVLRAKPPRRA